MVVSGINLSVGDTLKKKNLLFLWNRHITDSNLQLTTYLFAENDIAK